MWIVFRLICNVIVDKGFLVEYKLFLIEILDFGKFWIVIVIVNVLFDV